MRMGNTVHNARMKSGIQKKDFETGTCGRVACHDNVDVAADVAYRAAGRLGDGTFELDGNFKLIGFGIVIHKENLSGVKNKKRSVRRLWKETDSLPVRRPEA